MQRLEDTLLLLAGQDPAIDSKELIERIERHLSQEAVQVVARDGSSIMQTEVRPHQTMPLRPARRGWVAAVALLAVIAAIGIPVWLFGGDDGAPVVSEPEAPFSWGDDIYEWVTPDEMKDMFDHLSRRYAGVEPGGGEVGVDRSGLGMDTDVWHTSVWRYEAADSGPVENRTWIVGIQRGELAGPRLTDSRLPEGVVFEEDWAGGQYILSGPNSTEAISINLSPPHDLRPYPEPTERYHDMYFELASMMLRELGWAD